MFLFISMFFCANKALLVFKQGYKEYIVTGFIYVIVSLLYYIVEISNFNNHFIFSEFIHYVISLNVILIFVFLAFIINFFTLVFNNIKPFLPYSDTQKNDKDKI